MESIERIILKGLLKDISKVDRCYRLNKKIAKQLSVISDLNKKEISRILYDLSYTEMVLGLARLYDKSNQKYPVRCLKSLYQELEEQNYEVPIISSNDLFRDLIYFGIDEGLIAILENSNEKNLSKRVMFHFKNVEVDDLSSDIDKLRNIRDKILAHNEDIELENAVSYDLVQTLLDHAKNVVSFFSLAYNGTQIKKKGKYPLYDSVIGWSKSYDNFLNDN